MISNQNPVLLALAAFLLKHFICDFALQTPRQIMAKGHYGRLGGIEHAGLHAIGSIVPLCILTHSPLAIGAAMLIEFVIHYHVDFGKARLDAKLGLTNKDTGYWIVFGLDQLIHQMTYVGMIYFLEPLS